MNHGYFQLVQLSLLSLGFELTIDQPYWQSEYYSNSDFLGNIQLEMLNEVTYEAIQLINDTCNTKFEHQVTRMSEHKQIIVASHIASYTIFREQIASMQYRIARILVQVK